MARTRFGGCLRFDSAFDFGQKIRTQIGYARPYRRKIKVSVSFILPAYKRRFLKEAIASILAQTYRDIELVVVDDNSPEKLEEVVNEFKDERLKFIHHEVNLGGKNLVAAWDYAMTFATGEWCVLASDDDIYLPQYTEKLLELAAEHPEARLLHSRIARIDAEGKWINVGEERAEIESPVRFVFARAALGLAQAAPEFMFRLEDYRKLGGFVDFPLAWFSDDATWFSFAKEGVVCTSEVLFLFRSSGINISSKTDNILKKLEAGEEYRRWFEKYVESLEIWDEEDKFLKARLIPCSYERIDKLAFEEFESIRSFTEWRKCLKASPFPADFKRRVVYARFPALLTLRRMLP